MYSIILSTTNTLKNAKDIAHSLICNKLAACINIVPKVISVYPWEGEVKEDSEFLLIIKSKTALFDKVKEKIIKLHPYSLPEIISVEIKNGSKDYLNWIKQNIKIF